MNRPNILYLHSHDTGRYIQPYGHAIATPNLQKLAEQGVLFRQNFCANPTCSPSRACLLTGQSAHGNGMIGLAHRGFAMNDYKKHVLHSLRKAGYYSALAGVQHVAKDPSTIGYDEILGERRDALDRAIGFLENPPSQPFFLSVGFSETHRPFPEDHPLDDARHCLPPAPLPDTPEVREDMARFKACARILDRKMGAVLDAVERGGLADNTLVICTTDHGIAFPRMKCNLHDSGIGVMLIMRGPGGFTGGRAVDSLVSHVDIFPTICDLLAIDPPEWLEGRSMMPLIRGEKEDIREEIHAEVNYHASYEPMRCVRTRRWKYIKRYDGRARPVLPNCDDSHSKALWMLFDWRDRQPGEEQLYDVIFDPNETNNLASDPAHNEILADMRGRLQRWMESTRDPLLEGCVPAPPEAVVNDVDGVSPREVTIPAADQYS